MEVVQVRFRSSVHGIIQLVTWCSTLLARVDKYLLGWLTFPLAGWKHVEVLIFLAIFAIGSDPPGKICKTKLLILKGPRGTVRCINIYLQKDNNNCR